MKKIQKRYPVSFVNSLIVLLSLCSLVIVLLLCFFQRQETQGWFTDTARKTLTEKSEFISHKIEMYLDKPKQAATLLAHLVNVSEEIDTPVIEQELQHVLEEDFSGSDSISRIGIASENGQYTAYQRNLATGQLFLIKTAPGENHRLNVYQEASEASATSQFIDDYDLYSRPWYIQAMTSKKPFWSHSYYRMSRNEGQIMSWRLPIYHNNQTFKGVIFADIYPSVLSEFLRKLAPGTDSTLLLIDKKHNILASSKNKYLASQRTTSDGENPHLNNLASFPQLNAYLQGIRGRQQSTVQVSQGGKDYFVVTHPIYDAGHLLDWSLVMITPQALPASRIMHGNIRNLAILSLLIGIFLLGMMYLVRKFFRSLDNLLRKTRLLGQQSWEPAGKGALFPEIAALEDELSTVSGFVSNMLTEQKDRIEKDSDTGLLTRVGLFNEPTLYTDRNLLMMIRLTNFRDVRSTLGHTYAQTFIRVFASHLQQIAPEDSIFCRYSEDLFIIVFPGKNEQKDVDTYWDLLDSLLQNSASKQGQTDPEDTTHVFAAQAGAILETLTVDNISDCMMNAGLALQKIRTGSSKECALFTPEMRDNELKNIRIHQALREDLLNNGLHLVLQPIISLDNTQTFREGECLIRWISPTLGFVPPDVFIGIAERTGMITMLGRWIIEEACRELAAFITRGAPVDFKLHINISAVQLQQADFSEHLLTCIQQNGLMNSNICLEITESVLLQNSDNVIETLNFLRRLGLSVAIDDFGSGYSSLSYLHLLPFDCLKIDRDFVKGVMDDKKSEAIISSVIMLSQCFGVPLVAEGIETVEMGEKLQTMGCEKAQGYYYGRPQKFEIWQPDNGIVPLAT